jgi:hypothetical protein
VSYVLSLIILTGLASAKSDQGELFDNYTQAYRVAQETHRSMLVILNPGGESRTEKISLVSVRKTKQRRELLRDYIVVVIDTGTQKGIIIRNLFDNPPLPFVSIIDKRQEYQVYQSSEKMYGQLWTEILETYRNGESIVQARLCST